MAAHVLNIEQKNPFIKNVNKHMFNFEKLRPAAELQFCHFLLLNVPKTVPVVYSIHAPILSTHPYL